MYPGLQILDSFRFGSVSWKLKVCSTHSGRLQGALEAVLEEV